MQLIKKALLLPVNSAGQVLLQDREHYNPPRWGLFGGSIEKEETPIQALIREVKEELNLDLKESDVELLGVFTDIHDYKGERRQVTRYCYTWQTELKESDYTVLEGDAAVYFDFADATSLLNNFSKIDGEIIEAVTQKYSNWVV